MNQKKKIENYQQIAMGTGLRYDETNDLFHGERDGFDFIEIGRASCRERV